MALKYFVEAGAIAVRRAAPSLRRTAPHRPLLRLTAPYRPSLRLTAPYCPSTAAARRGTDLNPHPNANPNPNPHPTPSQVRRCKKEDLRRIAKLTGGTLMITLADMEGNETYDASMLGQADEVRALVVVVVL